MYFSSGSNGKQAAIYCSTQFVHILLHAEFSALDYTLNIVSKCRFFFIFQHLRAPKRSWKIFQGGPGKVLDFFVSVKEWEPFLGAVSQSKHFGIAPVSGA